MIATGVALVLLAALALFVVLAGAGFAAAAIAGFLALPFALMAPACALSRHWRAGASARLGIGGFLRLAAGETVAFVRTFLFAQALQPWLAPRDPARIEPGAMPVLFVHGIYCNAGVWYRQLAHLRRAAVPNLFCLNLEPPLASIDRFAEQLAQRVDEVCRASGASKVILVAHSMGGLVARAWLARLGGSARTVRLVTLGSPHRGSRLARLAPGRCAAEMAPGSRWLAQLQADEVKMPSVPVTCVASWHDSLVAPQDSALLPGASSLTLERLGHLQLLVDPGVHRRVAEEIAAARSESPS
jgi:triacylglycerol esterase/lipase EstA (alpha/beta hydrolase family)